MKSSPERVKARKKRSFFCAPKSKTLQHIYIYIYSYISAVVAEDRAFVSRPLVIERNTPLDTPFVLITFVAKSNRSVIVIIIISSSSNSRRVLVLDMQALALHGIASFAALVAVSPRRGQIELGAIVLHDALHLLLSTNNSIVAMKLTYATSGLSLERLSLTS